MTSRPELVPTADHPITVQPLGRRVRVTSGDVTIADTTEALNLQESTYPAVYYVPLADVDAAVLRRNDHSTYCPYKGDASYYSVVTPDGELDNVVWEYQDPRAAVAGIKDHVAFYADKVDVAVG